MTRWALLSGLLIVPLLGTVDSAAQGSKAAPAKASQAKKGKEATPAPAEAAEEAAPSEPAGTEKTGETAPAPAGGDLGEPPPRAVQGGTQKKLSPLNPAKNEFPEKPPPPPPAELDKLLGDIAALRSRVAALTTTLFKSKLRVIVEAPAGDSRIESLVVTLDDGVVFASPDRFSADEEREVYRHSVAPGQHVLGVEIERYDVRGPRFRNWQSSRFTVEVPESGVLEATVELEDDSDMADDFPDDQDGEYELSVSLRARVVE